jgi:hypothetical protein
MPPRSLYVILVSRQGAIKGAVTVGNVSLEGNIQIGKTAFLFLLSGFH